MNRYTFILVCISMLFGNKVAGNGIAYVNADDKIYMDILSSHVNVRITDQVSVTSIEQLFYNPTSDSVKLRYAFPLLETASATLLRYRYKDLWYDAAIAAEPQDSLDEGGIYPGYSPLGDYLGATPLIYDIETQIYPGDSLYIELSYVELLPYKLGQVSYVLPFAIGNLLEDESLDCQFDLTLYSQRSINSIDMLYPYPGDGETGSVIYEDSARIVFTASQFLPQDNISISYELSSDELGMFCLSSFMPDSLVPDELGNGFFTFIVEPEPQAGDQIISKNFTLIIDRSGSMSGNKIVDARNAAIFIVQNLNENDRFNIVSFSDNVSSFRDQHVENTSLNRNQAITYINALTANGSTNISGAFSVAVPQFAAAQENTANIIIFLTDGEQTSGILGTTELIDYINNLVVSSETDINLFSFGIGGYTNEQLLRTISYENQGLSEFLADNLLESMITEFFLLINNPVLLRTSMVFSPAIIHEIFPAQLPNLYIGQQMILSGRYFESAETEARISGTAFGNPVMYTYNPDLASTYNPDYLFLMKIWAKQKIETLLNEYYTLLNDTSLANPIRRDIIRISIDYGVISPFTSYRGTEEVDWGSYNLLEDFTDAEKEGSGNTYISDLKVLGGNSFGDTYLYFSYDHFELKPGMILITSMSGQIIAMEDIPVRAGENWLDISYLIRQLPKGIYTLTLQIETTQTSVLFPIR